MYLECLVHGDCFIENKLNEIWNVIIPNRNVKRVPGKYTLARRLPWWAVAYDGGTTFLPTFGERLITHRRLRIVTSYSPMVLW